MNHTQFLGKELQHGYFAFGYLGSEVLPRAITTKGPEGGTYLWVRERKWNTSIGNPVHATHGALK